MDRCKHEIESRWCAVCNPKPVQPEEPRTPQQRWQQMNRFDRFIACFDWTPARAREEWYRKEDEQLADLVFDARAVFEPREVWHYIGYEMNRSPEACETRWYKIRKKFEVSVDKRLSA